MKNNLFLAILFLVLNNKVYSQFNQNSWEAGILINGGLTSTSAYTSDPGNSAYLNLNILPAYYILNGFSIEPQITIYITEHIEPEFNFIGNLSYTYRVNNSGFAPYIKAGYGVSNSVSIKKLSYDWQGGSGFKNKYHSDKFNIGVFNSSIGMKFLINKKTALRGELNYKIYNGNAGYEGPVELHITQLSFLGGLSFLF